MTTFKAVVGTAFLTAGVVMGGTLQGAERDDHDEARRQLGRALFNDVGLSRDHTVACATCHKPDHAYSDPRPVGRGVAGRIGTRNAPSLVTVATESAFFWDGRRGRLEDVVLDPFTNPVEFGLASRDDLLERLRHQPQRLQQFQAAYTSAETTPTVDQVADALATFVRALPELDGPHAATRSVTPGHAATIELGRSLFSGVAGCSECHVPAGAGGNFTDGRYHHSGVSQSAFVAGLPSLAKQIVKDDPNVDQLGPKVLTDPSWSAMGRFVVTHAPADIGAYRTPSLWNVSLTAPYMHDGSVPTLTDAVDRELFYRGFSRGRPLTLSPTERHAIVAYLETLRYPAR